MSRVPHRFRCVLAPVLLFAVTVASVGSAEPLRDGQRFDPGASMTHRADNAPEALDRFIPLLGTWTVSYTVHAEDGAHHTSLGRAELTLMNRGHAFMERFRVDDCDGEGNPLDTITFLCYPPTIGHWVVGVADSRTESIRMFDGGFEGESFVVGNAVRRLGGATVTHQRLIGSFEGADDFTVISEHSEDGGETWTRAVTRAYTRDPDGESLFAGSGMGSVAPDRPEAAGQFDFLVGEWDFQHQMTFPGGQKAAWPANGTAVHVMDGRAIMEFSWFDVDPNLPNAATTIVRIYNRQMRRWESMYTTNRFNSILHFGGVQEGDRIVLHQFNADTGDSPISYWIFHDIAEDSYGWHAETSKDRGETFEDTWIIDATRKATP